MKQLFHPVVGSLHAVDQNEANESDFLIPQESMELPSIESIFDGRSAMLFHTRPLWSQPSIQALDSTDGKKGR